MSLIAAPRPALLGAAGSIPGGYGRPGGARRFYRLLVDSLYSSPGSILPGGAAAALSCYLCYQATGDATFAETCAIVSLIVLLRGITILRYRRLDPEILTIRELRRWSREFVLGGTSLSLTLGVNCFLTLVLTTNAAAHLIAVTTNVAFSSGYVARNAARPRFVVSQLLLFCGPMAAGLLAYPDPYYNAIGYFTFLFVASSIAITMSVYRNLVALGEANDRSEKLADVLKVQNVTLDAALNNMNFGLVMFDRDMRVAVCNRRLGELLSVKSTDCGVGVRLDDFSAALVAGGLLSAAAAGKLSETCCEVSRSGQDSSFEVSSGERHLVVMVEAAPENGVVVLVEDATERRQTEAKIERLARFDDLTGLANRFELQTEIVNACGAAGGARFALLYIDLDNFKQVNDSFGHEVGDAILAMAADRLRSAASPGDIVARFGGDEFVIVRPAFLRDNVLDLADRIVQNMSPTFTVGDRVIYAGASVGIALAPEHGVTPSDVLRHADVALYKAKAAGRSGFVVFSPEMGRELAERHDLEAQLRRALERNELTLFYQPIVDLKSGRVAAYEALMRWQHPKLGMVSPARFIPIAEQAGLIRAFGEFALDRACRDAGHWDARTTVSVNVSPMQFRNPDLLIAAVQRALMSSGLAPRRLSLEVTESVLMDDLDGALKVMESLRQIGVQFSLDDFGSGFSSLAYLSKFPFYQVKIDRAFASAVTHDSTSQAIIETVGQLARRLGMNFLVEGIETQEQLEAVRLLGAEYAQGYLFGRPEPLDSVLAQVAKRVA